jgi:hypothetical protein
VVRAKNVQKLWSGVGGKTASDDAVFGLVKIFTGLGSLFLHENSVVTTKQPIK